MHYVFLVLAILFLFITFEWIYLAQAEYISYQERRERVRMAIDHRSSSTVVPSVHGYWLRLLFGMFLCANAVVAVLYVIQH